ncbi:hypothetical protein USDA257_p04310 (plasmid) [Sinorhizobium fredii USDA 257]|uniref:Uncharacterized protein n=1 Tax=Sinorhizobium fredii (strain USDA 257) TaxID=1185652 RepID=I3XGZ0_SINF2|nr:hypothetical protein USDA257_p04310 [Sinorhizobium fredii USDA 257]
MAAPGPTSLIAGEISVEPERTVARESRRQKTAEGVGTGLSQSSVWSSLHLEQLMHIGWIIKILIAPSRRAASSLFRTGIHQ